MRSEWVRGRRPPFWAERTALRLLVARAYLLTHLTFDHLPSAKKEDANCEP